MRKLRPREVVTEQEEKPMCQKPDPKITGFFSNHIFLWGRKDHSKGLCWKAHLIFPDRWKKVQTTPYSWNCWLLKLHLVYLLIGKNSGKFQGEKDFSLALNISEHCKHENLMSRQLVYNLFYISAFKQWFYICVAYICLYSQISTKKFSFILKKSLPLYTYGFQTLLFLLLYQNPSSVDISNIIW